MGSKEVFENGSIKKVVLGCFYFFPGTKKKVGKFSRRILFNNLTSLRGSNREYGKGGGNPFQCSCLEDPMDRGRLADYSSWGRKGVRHDLATKQQK